MDKSIAFSVINYDLFNQIWKRLAHLHRGLYQRWPVAWLMWWWVWSHEWLWAELQWSSAPSLQSLSQATLWSTVGLCDHLGITETWIDDELLLVYQKILNMDPHYTRPCCEWLQSQCFSDRDPYYTFLLIQDWSLTLVESPISWISPCLLSYYAFPRSQTHDLGIVSTMHYCLSKRKGLMT